MSKTLMKENVAVRAEKQVKKKVGNKRKTMCVTTTLNLALLKEFTPIKLITTR